ncbi:hypothetical protein LCGC14_2618460 [marine sediment metagenome]|uniref:Lipoprotein n=1 Tax=marine sediment metagenome TaxID=412755 RepID=A0A0F9A421_9ZZZZ
MKKLIIAILCCFFLMGCVINRLSVYKVRGDKLGFPVGGIIPVSGEDIKGVLVHWLYWTNESGRKIPPMPTINIQEKGEDETTDDVIDVK